MPDYPIKESMVEVVELCGIELALALCCAFPGIRVYVPEKMHDKHELVHKLGMEMAEELHRFFSRDYLIIPVDLYIRDGHRKDIVLSLYKKGKRIADISRQAELSQRQVWRIVFDAKKDGWDSQDNRQTSLFS